MRERPILFTPANVRLILAGQKVQTRRVAHWKERPKDSGLNLDATSLSVGYYCTGVATSGFVLRSRGAGSCWNDRTYPLHCPYGQIGDRLWVKEAWRVGNPHDKRSPTEIWDHLKKRGQGVTVLYESGGWHSTSPIERVETKYPDDEKMPDWAGRKRSSMFMPRWASRITLEITDVRIEKVQDISEDDAIAEGIKEHEVITGANCNGGVLTEETGTRYFYDGSDDEYETASDAYAALWDSINKAKHPWSQNPFCWCLSFRKLETK